MVISSQLQASAQIFAGNLLNGVALGIAITFFGWILLKVLGRQSARLRFAAWFSVLIAVAAMAFLGPFPGGDANSTITTASPGLRLPGAWALNILAVWAVIASLALVRVGFGFLQLVKLRRSCERIDPSGPHAGLCNAFADFRPGRRVAICSSNRVRVPVAIGFLKPLIVIHAWALEELSPIELNAILLHEFAHLHRWDDWTNLAQRVVRALLFFHPAVWWIGTNLSLEREMACDEFVLAVTSDHRAYAKCLVSVAEKSFLRRGLDLAQAVVGRMHQVSKRVARVLDIAPQHPAGAIRKTALALVSVLGAAFLISLPHVPRLVAFTDDQPGNTEQAGLRTPSVASQPGERSVEATLVPAAIREQSPVAPRRKSAQHEKIRRVQNPSFVQASLPSSEGAESLAVPLNSTKPVSMNSVSFHTGVSEPTSILLLMQTQALDPSGRMVWSISVWHLTIFHPAENQIQTGTAAKST
jgi:beta-lactamase regulating signal transducer with metallopeptidase domain